MRLLLDTCTFLWYINADRRLASLVRDQIRSADTDVWLSAVSVWEAGVKQQLAKLELPAPAASYLIMQREKHGIEPLSMTEDAVAHLAKLPKAHRDPFDRMLICQAIEHDLVIATPDCAFDAYPVKVFWG